MELFSNKGLIEYENELKKNNLNYMKSVKLKKNKFITTCQHIEH